MSLAPGAYSIVSVGAPTLAGTFIAENSTLRVRTNTNSIPQIWTVTKENGQYFIKATPSVQYAAVENGNLVGTDVRVKSLPQGWAVEASNLGAYTIRTPNHNNVWAFIGNAEADVKIASLNPSDANQKWRFVPA